MRWFDDPMIVLRFAHILHECGVFLDGKEAIDSILDYFEKPWKWDDEHTRWVKLGRPAAADISNASDLTG